MSERLRRLAVELYQRGLDAITPEILMQRALRLEGKRLAVRFLDRDEHVALHSEGRIALLAVGKAAAPMAAEAHRLLGGAIAEGLVVTKAGFSMEGLPFPVRETGHPVPDESGIAAAETVRRMVEPLGVRDLLLVLVSGGASALLPAPREGITLEEKQRLIDTMLRTEMDIHEINRVRKAISRFKGGGLAALAHPARVLGLYLSDVPGDALSSIGSGPTVPEPVDAAEVAGLLRRKGIWEQTPPSIRELLQSGGAAKDFGRLSQPPINGLIGANIHLLRTMQQAAEEEGFFTRIAEEPTTGLNAVALPRLLHRWVDFCAEPQPVGEGLCFISGGETLVEVTGNGMGGRCQELAALMMPRLDGRTAFLAAGSDGNDGPNDAAGGVVDRESWQRIQDEGIPYDALLKDNDTYHLLERSGNLIKVPPTRNNVMDVHLFLRKS